VVLAQAADDRASELASAFAQVATLSVRAAAEELTARRTDAERRPVAPDAGSQGAGEAAVIVAALSSAKCLA
jgi:hypothetical protein